MQGRDIVVHHISKDFDNRLQIEKRLPTEVTPHVDDEREGVAHPDGAGDPRARDAVPRPDLHLALGRRQREVHRIRSVYPERGRG